VLTLFLMLTLPRCYAVLRDVLPLTLFINSFAALLVVWIRDSRLRPVWLPLLIILPNWKGRFNHGPVVLHSLATQGPEYVVFLIPSDFVVGGKPV
jgi:hypothetical protein